MEAHYICPANVYFKIDFMNSKVFKSLWIAIICCLSFSASAVVMVKAVSVDSLTASNKDIQPQGQEALKESTLVTKGWKSSKRFKRVKRLIKRVFKKNNSFGNVLASGKFRLGALLLLIGIIGAIVINIFTLAQIFGWLAGIIALAGLVLMIWSLIEHS
ncbi:MAG: hypothetical protein ACI8YQ_004672 [Polaribacter sp.]|jgi:hypothetical protein